jgi:transcriptional regulator with XRE-family HTH domain
VPVTATNTPPGFAAWLQRQLDVRRWPRSELVRRSGIGKDRLSKWLRAEEVPRLDAIRAVCAALGVPAVEGMVAAGHLRPDDVGAVVVQPPGPWRPSKRELLLEIARRIPDVDLEMQAEGATVTQLPVSRATVDESEGLYDEDAILGPPSQGSVERDSQ